MVTTNNITIEKRNGHITHREVVRKMYLNAINGEYQNGPFCHITTLTRRTGRSVRGVRKLVSWMQRHGQIGGTYMVANLVVFA